VTKKIVDDLYVKMLRDVRSAEKCWDLSREILRDVCAEAPGLSAVEVDIRLDSDREYTTAVKDSVFFMSRAAAYAAVHDTVLARMLHRVSNPDGSPAASVGQRGNDTHCHDEQAQAERQRPGPQVAGDPGGHTQARRRDDE